MITQGSFKFELCQVEEIFTEGFVHAWETAFSRKLTSAIYDWIFRGRNLKYAALDSGKVVAGYCLYPVEAIWEGKPISALLGNNIFVIPEYQGKNLVVRLGRYALSQAEKSGYTLAYGIPRSDTISIHLRVGWTRQRPIHFLARDRQVGAMPDSGIVWKQGTLDASELAKLEDCSRQAAQGRGFSVIKNRDFATWRYLLRPNASFWFGLAYKREVLLAYCVCKYYPEKQCLHFIDIDGTDSEAVMRLVNNADTLPDPFTYTNLWESTVHADQLKESGYHNIEEHSDFILIRPYQKTPMKVSAPWQLVLGDNDVY